MGANVKGEVAGDNQRYLVLDALRGVCACMVVLYHLKAPGMIGSNGLVRASFLFVDFFFVLSGFVIASSYGRRLEDGFPIHKFMALRLGRLYPLHLFVLAAFLAFEIMLALHGGAQRGAFQAGYAPGVLLATLTFTQIFFCDGTDWNQPSWSIAAEFWTYLIFALLFRLLRARVILACVIVPVGCALYLWFVGGHYLAVVLAGALARCLYGFALGVLACRIRSTVPPRAHLGFGPASIAELIAAAAVVTFVPFAGAGPWSMAIPPLFFLVVLVFSFEGGAISKLLATAPFQLLGALSFSIYMIHSFLLLRLINVLEAIEKITHHRWALTARVNGGNVLAPSPLLGDLIAIAFLGGVIACAYATYRLIEQPGRRWSRRLVLGRHPRPATIRAEREAPTF